MESRIFRLHATPTIQRYYLVLDFIGILLRKLPLCKVVGKNIPSSLVVYQPKCTISLAQYDARICGYSLGCCKQEEKNIFDTTFKAHQRQLSSHKSLPITFFQEHHETSKYKDVNKRFVPFWFKDLEVVFNQIQGAPSQITITVDESPCKKLLNIPFNIVHPPIFTMNTSHSCITTLIATL